MSPDVVPVASISVNTHEADVFGIFSVLFQQFPRYCCISNFRVIAVSIVSVSIVSV